MRLKRVLSGLLACAMASTMLSAFAMTANAAESVGIEVATVNAVDGKFSVDVKLTSVPTGGIAALEFAVGFDSSALTITGVTAGSIADTGAAAEELKLNADLASTMVSGSSYSCLDYAVLSDQVSVSWVTAMTDTKYWLKSAGTLCTITGTVKSGVADGTYPLTVEAINRETYSGSGVYNTKVYFAAGDADLKTTYYTEAKKDGAVIVGSQGGTEYLFGDINKDGKINVQDVAKLAKAAIGQVTLTADEMKLGDLNGDGKINVQDVAKLAKAALKLLDLGTITL